MTSDDAIDEEEQGTWLRTAATLLACGSIVLVLVNAALVLKNQRAQAEVAQRQQVINQYVQLSRVSQFLIQTVGKVAVANHDDALMAALERHGIHVQQAPPPATPGETGAKP